MRSYRTFSPLPTSVSTVGGLFSVALSRRSPWVTVSDHRALWSPDFPRVNTPSAGYPEGHLAGVRDSRSPWLTHSRFHYRAAGGVWQTARGMSRVDFSTLRPGVHCSEAGGAVGVELDDGQRG